MKPLVLGQELAFPRPPAGRPPPPFDGFARLRRELRRLAAAGASKVELPFAVEDPALAAEIAAAAKRSGVSVTMPVERGASLRGGRLRRVLARLCPPRDRTRQVRPLEKILFTRTLGSSRDYDELIADLSAAANEIDAFSSSFFVRFEARLRLVHLDGGRLLELCGALAGRRFRAVDLAFALPEMNAAEAARVKEELRRFCADPAARSRYLRVRGLPFCFLPAESFPLLYASLTGSPELAGDLARQRSELSLNETAPREFLPPCLDCRRRRACYALSGIEGRPGHAPHLEPSLETTLAFAGASLTPEDRARLKAPDLVFTRPAEQGSFFIALLEGFRDILLLDGYFLARYSCTTFEVALALERGVNVFGAASMGALRALELDRYGMRGSGYVYRFLKRKEIVPYHAVAQTYDGEDRPLSVPLVAVRYLLEEAAREGVIAPADVDPLYAAADAIHFPRMTHRRFLETAKTVSEGAAEALSRYLERRGAGAFDVKRLDALELLGSFRDRIRCDGPDYAAGTFKAAKRRCLALLRSKFPRGWDRSLARGWREPRSPGASKRERPTAEVLALAERFVEDLHVVKADIARFDPLAYHCINMVFVPFYFLGYFLSAASGYGRTEEEALITGSMELVERISLALWIDRRLRPRRPRAPVFPARRLPLFGAVSPERKTALAIVDAAGRPRDVGLIEGTEIMSGRRYSLTLDCVRYPSSSGVASGGTLLECVVYGLYELIERDVTATYESEYLAALFDKINLDPDLIRDGGTQALIRRLRERGEKVAFFELLNVYGLPVVRCILYSPERNTSFQGFNCRLEREEAMARSFQEALNVWYIFYSGTRDDKRAPDVEGSSLIAAVYEGNVGRPLARPDAAWRPRPLLEVLEIILGRLRRNGIRRVFAVDLSPKASFGLRCVRVIAPGLDYPDEEGSAWTRALIRKCLATGEILRAQARRGSRRLK